MRSTAILPILALYVLAGGVGCRGRSFVTFGNTGFEQRLEMAPAKDSAEWLARLDRDLSEYNLPLAQLYAELPPAAEWPTLIEAARKKAATTGHQDKTSLAFFLATLAGDQEAARDISRSAAFASIVRDHQKSEGAKAVIASSKDPAEGLAWIRANQPDWLSADRGYNSSHQPKVKPWTKDLAEGRVKEGLARLWEAADDKENSSVVLEKIMAISRLTGDAAGETKAWEKLSEHLQKSTDTIYVFGIRNWLDHAARNQEWDVISALADKQTGLENQWQKKHWQALQLFALRQKSGTSAFLGEFSKTAASWSYSDLLGVLSLKLPDGKTFGELYARGLAETGRTKEAEAVALHVLALTPGEDPAFQLVKDLAPAAFEGFLEKLRLYDTFEERPLIWQAKAALAKGDIPAARKAIDEAVRLDPSDGEQGKDTRMAAYQVVAEVEAAEGKPDKAAFFRDVVRSIREGEAADDYLQAGLTGEAAKRYRAALGKFSDAYCLQSRLALTLARDGKFEEAVPHFKKAFELMPVSFGPRESHCFGCEGLYSDRRVLPIAKEILSRFAAEHPDNARAPYLLGMVLEESEAWDEAEAAYRKAWEIDPQYYNAAKHLAQLLHKFPARSADHQKLLPQLATIAPYAEIGEVFNQRADLRAAWEDAGNVPPSPLELPALPGGKTSAHSKDQYKATSGFSITMSDGKLSLDGWSREELLRNNRLLNALE